MAFDIGGWLLLGYLLHRLRNANVVHVISHKHKGVAGSELTILSTTQLKNIPTLCLDEDDFTSLSEPDVSMTESSVISVDC